MSQPPTHDDLAVDAPRYLCRICRQDLTDAVLDERTEDLDVLRSGRRRDAQRQPAWSVRVWCDADHENVFSGLNDD